MRESVQKKKEICWRKRS